MAVTKTKLEIYLEEQINKYKGICMPLKAGMLERMMTKKLPCTSMHPNPADEFCHADVGPSYRIIGEYERSIRKNLLHGLDPFEEPIMVEKMHPDGYMILNGHHRWAAAFRCDIKKVPVKIVNLTQETDIEKMLQNSKHDKRVSFDLDEVVWGTKDAAILEKALPFPQYHFYKERLALVIPALFHFLTMHGYDIWLYTASYYSYDYLKHLFQLYHVHADGVITGMKRKVEDTAENKEAQEHIKEMFRESYRETITIDRCMLLRTIRGQEEYEQYDVPEQAADWSREVITILETIEKGREDE
ncbi:MAG: ParB-like nuclease domain-containing protein [Lachnospiraceae bacterium]|nr:ParB-like nuclease domain-containing protein [Lachnospiraceae bacterium]